MEFTLVPSGKYLLISPLSREELSRVQKKEKKKDSPTILLPEDSKLSKTTNFSVVKLLSAGNLCTNFHVAKDSADKEDRFLLVRSNMVEAVQAGEQSFEVILEQHVMGELEPA